MIIRISQMEIEEIVNIELIKSLLMVIPLIVKKKQTIIDVKGVKTKEYIAKKKVFEDKFNLKITEIE